MKKILVTGTFDIVHPGHLYFLKKAKKMGDYLIVVIARDQTVRQIKRRPPLYSEKQRQAHLKKLKVANRIILGYLGDKLKIVQRLKPDVICLGYDQRVFTHNLKNELAKRGLYPTIVRLKAHKPHKFKSSLLRRNLIK